MLLSEPEGPPSISSTPITSGDRRVLRIASEALFKRLLNAVVVRTTSLVSGSSVVSKNLCILKLATVNSLKVGVGTGTALIPPETNGVGVMDGGSVSIVYVRKP